VKGIDLNWADYIPAPVPDARNFVASPVVAHFQYESDHPRYHPWQDEWGDKANFEALFRNGDGGVVASASFLRDGAQAWHESRYESHERRRERLKAEGVSIIPDGVDPWAQLAGRIEPHRELIAALRQAARERPDAYIHGDYQANPFELPIPSFEMVRNLTRLLFADALLAQRAGDTAGALENAHCIHRLSNLNPGMYFLVNAMIEVVATKGFEIPIQALALRDGDLTDAQLRELIDTSLQRHALADFERSMHHEIAGGAETIINGVDWDVIFLSSVVPQTFWDKSLHLGLKLFSRVMPQGWAHIMASRHVQYTSLILEPYDVDGRRYRPEALEATRAAIEKMYLEAGFFDSLAAIAMPAFQKVTETTLQLQCQQDMLGIACALELYRREHGDLPVSLEPLTPAFITRLHNDPVSGERYRYERLDPGNYRLWAVGMDGSDNGGINDLEKRDSNQPDLVWLLSDTGKGTEEGGTRASP
jgi:hypothetical protein